LDIKSIDKSTESQIQNCKLYKGTITMSEQIILQKEAAATVISNYFAAIRAMDIKACLETFTENASAYEPVGGNVFQGHQAISQFFEGIASVFETVGLTEEFVHIADNEVAVKWIGYGVGKNGKQVTFEDIDLFEINADGKIQTVQGYWNPTAMMAQLA
jgi:steroid Delta-isomerase